MLQEKKLILQEKFASAPNVSQSSQDLNNNSGGVSVGSSG
jgi:hypothetical protein